MMIAAASAIISAGEKLRQHAGAGRGNAAEGQIPAQDEDDDAEGDECAPGDMIGAKIYHSVMPALVARMTVCAG